MPERQASLTSPDSMAGEPRRTRGRLKIYLGTTPGAGKTFAMLREGQQRLRQGEDVVVGFVETYRRPRTEELVSGFEVIPRKRVSYRGTVLEDMDLNAVLARRPAIALVDELAHTNAHGLRHEKRWQDVEDLRDAGTDVITTLNVQHVESVSDVVERITGIPVRERLPDRVLDTADEIQFIDISPEALRKRMRHGNVYRPDIVETALRNFFRPGNLAALREIGLRLVAQSMAATREVRPPAENVLVAIAGDESSETLIRRGVRLARRMEGACLVVTVASGDQPPTRWEPYRKLTEELGCSFSALGGSDVASAVIRAAQQAGVSHVLVGESRRSEWRDRLRPTLADRLIDGLPGAEIHVIARYSAMRRPQSPSRPNPDALLRMDESVKRRRAGVRVYLGYARGCGATTAMLDEAGRRKARGTDVVVGAVKPTNPAEAVTALEVLGGPNSVAARDRLDVDTLLARNPEVACIDDLVGLDTLDRPRWEALPRFLAADITVLGTIHLLDLESARQSFAPMLKSAPNGTSLPDDVLSKIDELEIVDVSPDLLLRRLREGLIMPPADAARALQQEFRPDILAALRESAFRLIADHTDRRLVDYMRQRKIDMPWEVRPRIVACIPPRSGMEDRIRRIAAHAQRENAQFTVVSVRTPKLSGSQRRWLGEYAALVHQLKGEFVSLYGTNVAATLARYIRETRTTEVVLGHRRGRWRPWDTTSKVVRLLSDVDVHILPGVPDLNSGLSAA